MLTEYVHIRALCKRASTGFDTQNKIIIVEHLLKKFLESEKYPGAPFKYYHYSHILVDYKIYKLSWAEQNPEGLSLARALFNQAWKQFGEHQFSNYSVDKNI